MTQPMVPVEGEPGLFVGEQVKEPATTCQHTTPSRTWGRGSVGRKCTRSAKWYVVWRATRNRTQRNGCFCTFHAKRIDGMIEVTRPC